MVQYASNTCTSTGTGTINYVNIIWDSWASTGSTTTTTIWGSWVNATSSATTTCNVIPVTNAQVWVQWVDQFGVQQKAPLAVQNTYQPSQEQIAAQQRQAAEQQQRYAEQQKQRDAAHKKSMELLHENLTKDQRAALKKHGWFLVEGGKSKKTYRIHGNHHAGNIREVDKHGREIARYCVHASYEFALGDQLLAQALSLRLDEDHIIRTANKTALAA